MITFFWKIDRIFLCLFWFFIIQTTHTRLPSFPLTKKNLMVKKRYLEQTSNQKLMKKNR